MLDRYQTLKTRFQAHDQAHVLATYEHLPPEQQRSLLDQIEPLDLASLDELIRLYVKQRPTAELPANLEPAAFYPWNAADPARPYDAAKFRALGEGLIRRGKVAAFTVAGGQGTRLGWEGPKGTYPATVVTGKPLFRVFAEQLLATQRKYGPAIPWYIMTSPINDADTRAFFADNNFFGLRRQDIFMFPQGVLPSFDAATGKLLLASAHELAVNPDGHGGSMKALRESGAIDDMRRRGVEHISYFQVDNPLVRCVDPLFIGLHAGAPDSSAEMSSKMVNKAGPDEKVGVFCRAGADGKTCVIEYSDLPVELSRQTNAPPDGSLRFNAGSIAIHVIAVAFVERLTADAQRFALPYHRADKKVPYYDVARGGMVQPDAPNAVKLEAFVFDAIPLAKSSIVYETNRGEEFAPIKNADGSDSPATSHRIQSNRHGGWLESCGVKVPRNAQAEVEAKIEISPLTAMEPGDLNPAELPKAIEANQEIVI